MADWTDDERREFERYRRAGKEHVPLQSPRIMVGDRAAAPGGTGWAVEERLGGYLVKLEAGPPPSDVTTVIGDPVTGDEEVFYLPLRLKDTVHGVNNGKSLTYLGCLYLAALVMRLVAWVTRRRQGMTSRPLPRRDRSSSESLQLLTRQRRPCRQARRR